MVLLDEIEKAHPEVFDLFLQVFDEGRLTDSKGRTVNFTNTIIILTSNIGTSKVDQEGNTVLIDTTDPGVREQIFKELRKSFRPEFLNRIDEIILFRPLARENLKMIISLSIAEILKRVKDKGIALVLEDSAMELFLAMGYNPAYGARPLKRAIMTYLSKPLAETMLNLGQEFNGTIVVKAHPVEERLIFEDSLAFEDMQDHLAPPAPGAPMGGTMVSGQEAGGEKTDQTMIGGPHEG